MFRHTIGGTKVCTAWPAPDWRQFFPKRSASLPRGIPILWAELRIRFRRKPAQNITKRNATATAAAIMASLFGRRMSIFSAIRVGDAVRKLMGKILFSRLAWRWPSFGGCRETTRATSKPLPRQNISRYTAARRHPAILLMCIPAREIWNRLIFQPSRPASWKGKPIQSCVPTTA